MKDVRGILPEPSEEELEDFVRWWFNPRPHQNGVCEMCLQAKKTSRNMLRNAKNLRKKPRKTNRTWSRS